MKIFLTSVFVLMLVIMCYGQLYEPEHLWHRCGDVEQGYFGYYAAGIGDVNGDEYGDFILYERQPARDILFYGGNPPDTIPDMVFYNPYPYGSFGGSLENVGDVNGDGSDDFASAGSYQVENRSKVFVYYGGTILDTIPDVILSELTFGFAYGNNIEGVGDVDRDGYDDMAVHAPNYGNSRGKVWVYFGGSPMDSIADWEKEGCTNNVSFGRNIAGKGDLNGDDYDDFVIYEWTGYPNLAQTSFYIFYGSDQLDTIPDLVIDGEQYYPAIDLSEPSALVGDLNGDPYSDLVITAVRTYNAVIFHGGDPMDTEIDLILGGFNYPATGYHMNTSAAGDVNGDGYDDLIVAQLEGWCT